jgi:hypothetical protein
MGVPAAIGVLARGIILAKPVLSRQAATDTSASVPLTVYGRDGRLRGVLTRLKEGGTQGHLRTERGALALPVGRSTMHAANATGRFPAKVDASDLDERVAGCRHWRVWSPMRFAGLRQEA